MALTTISSLSESFVSGASDVADDAALSKDQVDAGAESMEETEDSEAILEVIA